MEKFEKNYKYNNTIQGISFQRIQIKDAWKTKRPLITFSPVGVGLLLGRATVNQSLRSFQRKIDSCAILRSLYAAGKRCYPGCLIC